MTNPLAVNPQAITLLNRAPFLTVGEYKVAPTAVDVSTLNIYATGNRDRDGALARLIERASSLADGRVFPGVRGGTLAASSNIESGYISSRRDGSFVLPCSYKPVLALQALSLGSSPSTLSAVTSGADVSFSPEAPLIVVTGAWGATQSLGLPVSSGRNMFAQWTYINGYPHTTLAANATAAATTLEVTSPLGIFAGTQLGIYDADSSDEAVTVASVSGTTITLTHPTLYAHALPDTPDAVGVSALPPVVKEATILLVSSLAKARGAEALVMASIDSPDTQMQNEYKDAVDDMKRAFGILDRFAVVR